MADTGSISSGSTASDSTTSNTSNNLPIIDGPATRQAANQQQSSLMQLPAEIRVMILRSVLVADEPLTTKSTYPDPAFQPPRSKRDNRGRFVAQKARNVQGYRLYPHVLGACQNLLREAFDLLYKQNTLVLRYTPPSWDPSTYSPYGFVDSEALQQKLVAQTPNMRWELTGAVSAYGRFQKYTLTGPSWDTTGIYQDLRGAVKALASVVDGKSVRVPVECASNMTRDSKR